LILVSSKNGAPYDVSMIAAIGPFKIGSGGAFGAGEPAVGGGAEEQLIIDN